MRFKFADACAGALCLLRRARRSDRRFLPRPLDLLDPERRRGRRLRQLCAGLRALFQRAHIPGNPNIVIQNMPGGGGIRAMLYLNSVAPKDGTTLGLVHSSVPFAPLYGIKAARFDPRKMNWIGSIDASTGICVAWHTSGIATWQDMLTQAIHGRQHRRGLADGNDAAHARQSVRHQNQSHCRLCGRQRHLSGDGARRSSGPLRRS